MTIYTGAGDEGETGLFGGGRVPKDHPRVEATGTVDELNALLGRALLAVGVEESRRRLRTIQGDLFVLGAYLSTRPRKDGSPHPHVPELPVDRPGQMEAWIDEATAETGELKRFILPGGSPGAAELHVARTACRRAERRTVSLSSVEEIAPAVLRYLNRLSDLLFALARLENLHAGVGDVEWGGGREGERAADGPEPGETAEAPERGEPAGADPEARTE